MEEVMGAIILIIASVVSIISKSNSKNKRPSSSRRAEHPYRAQASGAVRSTAPGQTFSVASMLPPQEPAKPAQPASMATMLPPREELKTAEPLVHAHDADPCQTHNVPGSFAEGNATEGLDPCHDGSSITASAADAGSGLNLDWSADSMVKAFVMQEVLTRPCQRRH